MNEDYEIPQKLYYNKEHEWVKVEGAFARVGITDYAQEQLGDVVYAELPEVGDKVKQTKDEKTDDMEFGAVESIKAISSLYSPLTGEIKEVNDELEDEPYLINSSPYDKGWICMIDPDDLDNELKSLLDATGYMEFLESI